MKTRKRVTVLVSLLLVALQAVALSGCATTGYDAEYPFARWLLRGFSGVPTESHEIRLGIFKWYGVIVPTVRGEIKWNGYLSLRKKSGFRSSLG